jgi:hypothetical protein
MSDLSRLLDDVYRSAEPPLGEVLTTWVATEPTVVDPAPPPVAVVADDHPRVHVADPWTPSDDDILPAGAGRGRRFTLRRR